MNRVFRFSMMLVAVMAFVVTACKEDTPPQDGKTLSVKLDIKSVGDTTATFTVTTANAEETYLYCVEAGTACDNAAIKANGVKVEGTETIVDNLLPETDYVAYALAVSGDDSAKAECAFTTEASADEPFDGYELNKVISAVYRNDNDAVAGNYEFTFGNTTSLAWAGDIQIFLDLYNVDDSDPLNPVLPDGEYVPEANYAPFTYNPTYSYVDIVVEGGEVVSSPIMGVVTVERSGPTYTITVEGVLMLLDNMEFSARYVGSIQFVQGGTSAFEFFEEDVTVEFDEAQMRYWGNWFYSFADDVGVEMFAGEFDDNGNLARGYYLHLSPLYMPKYADYNAENVPLAEGTYFPVRNGLTSNYMQPYAYTRGSIDEVFSERLFMGTYLQYVEGGSVKNIGLVDDGEMIVERDGDNYNITMNFIADNGVKLNLSYSGTMVVANLNDNDESMTPRPWTTLESDHVYNFPEEAVCMGYCLGEMIEDGYDSWLIMLYGANDEYPSGYGDMFTTEFVTLKGDRTSMPTGEYTVGMEIEDHTMFCGTTDYAGTILFTYYGDLTPDAEGYSSEVAPISSGSVVVEDLGDGNYKFTFDLVDDGGNKITGEWTGLVVVDDISDEVAGTTSAVAMPLSAARQM